MGPIWGLSEADGTQVGPMLATWTLLFGMQLLWNFEAMRYSNYQSRGYDILQDLTGSRPFEYETGPCISHESTTKPNIYNKDKPQVSRIVSDPPKAMYRHDLHVH